MGLILSVLWEVITCPVITLTILILTAIWVQLLFNHYDARYFLQSYSDCIIKKQFYRIFSSFLNHQSLLHLIINMMSLWQIRSIEQQQGSWFLIKNSCFLLILEAMITYLIIFCCIQCSSSINREMIQLVLGSFTWCGCSGMLLSWFIYISMKSISMIQQKESIKAFLLLGYFSFHPILAPIIMMGVYYLILPRQYLFSLIGGILTGYVFYFLVLNKFLWNNYWEYCYLMNILIFLMISYYYNEQLQQYLSFIRLQNNNEIIPIISFVGNNNIHNFIRNESIRDLFGFENDNDDENDIESSFQPLLSTTTTADEEEKENHERRDIHQYTNHRRSHSHHGLIARSNSQDVI